VVAALSIFSAVQMSGHVDEQVDELRDELREVRDELEEVKTALDDLTNEVRQIGSRDDDDDEDDDEE